jgi:DNA helicase II / ATP-dependent DNA helicase PcrA
MSNGVHPGPAALGRGVVVLAGDRVPAAWADAPQVVVDEGVLGAPATTLRALHEAWAARRSVAVVLGVDPDRLRAPARLAAEPWTVAPDLEPGLERLHFLVWANTYDARGARPPTWWWARKAERLGARLVDDDGPGDVVLPDGRRAWVDGGPRAPLDREALRAEVVHRESVDLGRLRVAPPTRAPEAELAPDQLAAVATPSGASRVLAPAGSGKTRVLTERLRHLLVDRDWEPELVLAVAYNVRAREEMEERTAGLGARVQTLNSLGLSVLREARGHTPRVLTEPEVRRELEGLVPLGRGRRRANTDPYASYLEGLTAVRLGLRDPADVEAERDDVPGLADAFPRYRAALRDAGVVDFDEQVYGAVDALLGDADLRARLSSRSRHLLVDEFQDLTPAHVLLLRLLALPGLEVFGVGDDDQVIYGYNGADPGFLLDYERLFPGAASSPLEVNYRCPVAVVDGARTLLGYNRRRVEKAIRPGPDADPAGDALSIERHPAEGSAAGLVDLVRGWLTEPGTEPDGIAVLARVNSLLLAPTVALAQAGIPVARPVGPEVLGRPGVRAALAYLRIGAAPEQFATADLLEVLSRPSRALPPWFREKWVRRRTSWSIPGLHQAAGAIRDDAAPKVRQLATDLEVVVATMTRGTTRDVLKAVRERVGLGGAMGLLDASKGGQVSSQLDDLVALEQVAALQPDPRAFEPWLRSALAQPSSPAGVTVSTIHRVKGLAWDRVAVVGVTDGLLPHRLAEDVEEERRIFHVAVTRGKRGVVILADADRPSAFLDELAGTAATPAERAPNRRARDPGATRGPRAAPPAAPEAALTPEGERVLEGLKVWRRGRARADGVAAFIVASNAVLRAVAEARPASAEELARVPGIGPTKLELYGDELLAVVAEA